MRQRKTLGRKPAPKTRSSQPLPNPGHGCWIYGRHAALAAIANPDRRILRIITVADQADAITDVARAGALSRPVPEITDARSLAALMPDDAVHQGIAVLTESLPEMSLPEFLERIGDTVTTLVVLDQVTDPRNLGAVLRAAAAFAAGAVVIQDRHAPAHSPALAKAASGALESVPVIRVVNIARALRTLAEAGFWCAGFESDEGSTPIDVANLGGRVAVVLGAEGSGLRRLVRESCDVVVRIPIAPAIDSLNVASTAAIALYELSRRNGWPGAPALPAKATAPRTDNPLIDGSDDD